MKLKFRLIVYAIVAFTIPIGIYIGWPQDWRQTLPWIAFVITLTGIYEFIIWKKS